ncbi:Uncharacterised protein [Mycobacteroides abscessus subsp. abscessus]|nr:Uncharacterised protein [Mycobacteroides abscessus subsp. abscessus]
MQRQLLGHSGGVHQLPVNGVVEHEGRLVGERKVADPAHLPYHGVHPCRRHELRLPLPGVDAESSLVTPAAAAATTTVAAPRAGCLRGRAVTRCFPRGCLASGGFPGGGGGLRRCGT